MQNSPFLLGHLMPAFVAASAALARSPKSAQKGQLTRGRRGERGEEEEEEEREQWEREAAAAAPGRQDLSGVNEGHCARMETSNGKPKLRSSFLFLLQSRRRRLPFSLTLFSLTDATFPLHCCFWQHEADHSVGAQPISRENFSPLRRIYTHVALFRHSMPMLYLRSVSKL